MFWKEIGKLGIGKDRRQSIPMEVLLPDGSLSTKGEDVLRVWKNGFSSLLNTTNSGNEDIQPLGNDIHSNENGSFDEPINLSELFKAVNNLKKDKACGIDEIPNEVLKSKKLCNFLLLLFNECYMKGVIPSIWKKRIINPIPKTSTSDRRSWNHIDASML